MNSACRRPWVSGIQQVSRPTEAWRTSSDVVLPRSSMVAFRCWPPWDTSPQWLGFAEAAFKIVSVKVCFCSCFIMFPFVQLHFIVAESIGNLFLLMKQSPGDHWQIPWLLISICRFEVRRCAKWFGCHLKGPSCRIGLKQLATSEHQSHTYPNIYHIYIYMS